MLAGWRRFGERRLAEYVVNDQNIKYVEIAYQIIGAGGTYGEKRNERA